MTITHQQVCQKIEREIELVGSLRKTATQLGVSAQYLGNVLAGNRGIGPKLLKALGLRRSVTKIVTYEPRRVREAAAEQRA